MRIPSTYPRIVLVRSPESRTTSTSVDRKAEALLRAYGICLRVLVGLALRCRPWSLLQVDRLNTFTQRNHPADRRCPHEYHLSTRLLGGRSPPIMFHILPR